MRRVAVLMSMCKPLTISSKQILEPLSWLSHEPLNDVSFTIEHTCSNLIKGNGDCPLRKTYLWSGFTPWPGLVAMDTNGIAGIFGICRGLVLVYEQTFDVFHPWGFIKMCIFRFMIVCLILFEMVGKSDGEHFVLRHWILSVLFLAEPIVSSAVRYYTFSRFFWISLGLTRVRLVIKILNWTSLPWRCSTQVHLPLCLEKIDCDQ